MSAPSVAARSSGASTTTAVTSHPITMPTGITAGDLLLLIFSHGGSANTTAPGDWFKYGGDGNGTNITGAIFYKWAAGSDTCTITTASAVQSSHIVLRIPNGGVPNGSSAVGNSTNSNPGAAFTFQNDDYLAIATRHGNGTAVPTAVPSGYTNMMNQVAAGSGGASTSTSEKAVTISGAPPTPGGSEDPGVWTNASAAWTCWTILIPTDPGAFTNSVYDDFSSGTIDTTTKWTITQPSGTTASVVSGVLNLTVNASTQQYVHIDIKTSEVTPIGRIWGVNMTQAPSAPASAETSFGAGPVSGGWSFLENGGNNNDEYDDGTGNVDQVDWAQLPVTATWIGLGRWPVSGDMCWAYSPDGIHWRRHYSRAWPWGSTPVWYGLSHGHYDGTQATASTAKFDNVKIFTGPASAGPVLPQVRRAGAWQRATGVKVRRGGAWVDVTAIKVRRAGAWVNIT